MDIPENIARRIDFSDGCWLWTGGISGSGYGACQFEGRLQNAHRVVYALLRPEALDDGLHVHHLCGVKHCVNPAHLAAITQRLNNLLGPGRATRGFNTHCERGHLFDAKNTAFKANGTRKCRACDSLRQRRKRAKASHR